MNEYTEKNMPQGGIVLLENEDKLKLGVDKLSEKEAKQILYLLIRQMTDDVEADPKDIYRQLKDLFVILQGEDVGSSCAISTFHLVFNESLATDIKSAINEFGYQATHKVIVFHDNLAVGPLLHYDDPNGRRLRAEWFGKNINIEGNVKGGPSEETHDIFLNEVGNIPTNASILIWVGDNANDQLGLRYISSLLSRSPNIISVINHTATSRFGVRTILEGKNLSQLSYKRMVHLQDEWNMLASQYGVLRMWHAETGKIEEVPADYFDAYLSEVMEREAGIHPLRVIGEVVATYYYCYSEYLEYRFRSLNGALNTSSNLK